MKEIAGNLWDHYGIANRVVCITTNGVVKKDGSLVMGAGNAKEAVKRDPTLPYVWGSWVRLNGNKPCMVTISGRYPGQLMSFPTKHNYRDASDLKLIEASARELAEVALRYPDTIFVLPRPGCGLGRRTWAEVRPLLEDLPDNVWVVNKE